MSEPIRANIGEGRYDEAVLPLDPTMYQLPPKHKLAARIIELQAELGQLETETMTHWCNPGCSEDCTDTGKKFQRLVGPWEEVSA